MQRNLDRRVETVVPVTDSTLKQELEQTLKIYDNDNCSTWDMEADGQYVKRSLRKGEECRGAQEVFIKRIGKKRKL